MNPLTKVVFTTKTSSLKRRLIITEAKNPIKTPKIIPPPERLVKKKNYFISLFLIIFNNNLGLYVMKVQINFNMFPSF